MSDKKKESSSVESCPSKGCKHSVARFGFCSEHFEHFKFGLIKKTGEKVLDYDKKSQHYQEFVARQKSSRKVA